MKIVDTCDDATPRLTPMQQILSLKPGEVFTTNRSDNQDVWMRLDTSQAPQLTVNLRTGFTGSGSSFTGVIIPLTNAKLVKGL